MPIISQEPSLALTLDRAWQAIERRWETQDSVHEMLLNPATFEIIRKSKERESARGIRLQLLGVPIAPSWDVSIDEVELH